MLYRLKQLRGNYPGQFWLMFWGMLISTIGSSMVWPFLMIYMTTRLKLPLTTAASLMTINAFVALISAFIAGPVVDRLGRKWALVISLLGLGVVYLFYTQASSYAFTAVLMALTGMFNPLYRVGGDAMMADLIPAEKRADAYALLRMSNNLGISIGPAIGGFVAATSYTFAFVGAAVGMSAYAVLLAIFAKETLPAKTGAVGELGTGGASRAATTNATGSSAPGSRSSNRGGLLGALVEYMHVFADRPFMYFIIAFTLNQVCAALIWVLLGVHVKTNFGVSESLYGFIPMTNAVMVVVLQALVTRRTKKFNPLPVLALGSLFYGMAVTSVAFGSGFWSFWLSMVVLTVGELMLMPTATTYTANLAPVDMRGRYMSIFSLTWGVAQGIGPVAGGYLSDHYGPPTPWLGGGVVGALAVTAFVVLAIKMKPKSMVREVAGD